MPGSSYAGSQRELGNEITPDGRPLTTILSDRQFTNRRNPVDYCKSGEQLLPFLTIPSHGERPSLREGC